MWPLGAREIASVVGALAPASDLLISGICAGDRRPRTDELYVALREDGYDGHVDVDRALEAGAALALVSDRGGPGRLLVPDTLVALRKLAAFFRQRFSFPVIAVGGSNGKTTTKEMIAAALAGPGRKVTKTLETMNGWTGIPMTLLDRAHHRDAGISALVVEIGIDAPGAMVEHARLVDADIAVLTMLGPEHLAGLGDVDTVAREELALFAATTRGPRVVNCLDPRLREWPSEARDVRVTFESLDAGAISYDGERFEAKIVGAHNKSNLACAVAVARALGRSPREIAAGLATFEAPSMRCEVHRLATDCILIDDAYNASPPSMTAALDLLAQWPERPRILVLGDMLDLGAASAEHHLALVPRLRELNARLFLYGPEMEAVHREIASAFLPATADPREFIEEIMSHWRGTVVLVKGSRGMALERVVWELREQAENTSDDDLLPFHPRFQTVCVTGTNGKTTTTSLLAAITEAAGEVSCRVTTIGAFVGREQVETEASGAAFVRTLLRAWDRGARTLAIETSSQSLETGFTKTWPARVGVFTNLSRDHLDYHGTPERYLVAKAQLFIDLPTDGVAVLNAADPSSALLDEVIDTRVRRLAYAAREVAVECMQMPLALQALEVTLDENGTHARLAPSPIADGLGGRIDLALVGEVHMENALAAALAGHALGYSFDAIRTALARFEGVPGRFQIVHRRPLVVVDYAHTPDALARTLATARALRTRRVIVVFGCGGDRDPGKREEMGAVAANGADVVYVTNDNPRSEDPNLIADAIERGAGRDVHRILDRAEAIRCAVAEADPADIVVIAGKGHEKTQEIGGHEAPFDDVEIATAFFG